MIQSLEMTVVALGEEPRKRRIPEHINRPSGKRVKTSPQTDDPKVTASDEESGLHFVGLLKLPRGVASADNPHGTGVVGLAPQTKSSRGTGSAQTFLLPTSLPKPSGPVEPFAFLRRPPYGNGTPLLGSRSAQNIHTEIAHPPQAEPPRGTGIVSLAPQTKAPSGTEAPPLSPVQDGAEEEDSQSSASGAGNVWQAPLPAEELPVGQTGHDTGSVSTASRTRPGQDEQRNPVHVQGREFQRAAPRKDLDMRAMSTVYGDLIAMTPIPCPL